MDDKFVIHVEIAGKDYALTINRKDEELTRAAAKQIREKINRYREHFSASKVDMKDLLAMVALQLSVDNLQLENKNDVSPFVERINTLNDTLKEYLETK
ncbi:MAG: cell division protein ZapA [Parabacteroides sp.]|nr:cell division protein ZapA [Parabacteroides sp.]